MSAGLMPRMRGRLLQACGGRPLHELDVQAAGGGVGQEALAAQCRPRSSAAGELRCRSVAVQQQRFALAAAAAQGDGSLAAAAALEFVGRVQGQPGAGGADRVAQGDGAAVDVALLQRDSPGP